MVRVERYRSGTDHPERRHLRGRSDVQAPVSEHARPVPGHGDEVIDPGHDVGGRSGQRDIQRVRRGGQSAEIDQESEVAVFVGPGLPRSEGGGDVPGDLLALALGTAAQSPQA